MNGVFGSGLSFWQILLLIVSAVLGTIMVRISINFNVNDYLKDRRKIAIQKLQRECPHMIILFREDKPVYCRGLFISPFGTLRQYCQFCGFATDYIDEYERKMLLGYYLNNPKKYDNRVDKLFKLLKKSGHFQG